MKFFSPGPQRDRDGNWIEPPSTDGQDPPTTCGCPSIYDHEIACPMSPERIGW